MNKRPIWEGDRWRIRVMINGKTKYFSSYIPGARGRRECMDKYNDWLDGKCVERLKFEIAWQRFIDRQEARNGSDSPHVYNLKQLGRLYIVPQLEGCQLSRLTVDDFQDVIDNARPTRANTQKNAKLSVKTLKNIRGTLTQFIKFAVARGYMEPLKDDIYIPAGHETKEKEILQPSDITKLFDQQLDDWYINYFRLATVCGLRPGECLGLQWQDIDFVRKTITIVRSINTHRQITEGKNKNARREIGLSDIAASILQDQKAKTADMSVKWVFPNPVGAMSSQSATSKAWNRLKDKTGIPGTPYSLRHTFISMLKYDVPESMIRSIVGHSVSMDTLGTYGHRVDGELQRTAALVDETLKKAMQ